MEEHGCPCWNPRRLALLADAKVPLATVHGRCPALGGVYRRYVPLFDRTENGTGPRSPRRPPEQPGTQDHEPIARQVARDHAVAPSSVPANGPIGPCWDEAHLHAGAAWGDDDAVPILDPSGFAKKATTSVRKGNSAAGWARSTIARWAVFLGYAGVRVRRCWPRICTCRGDW